MARVESEAGIIATLIHHPEFSYYSEQLLPNHFTNEENRYIYQAICSLARDGITTIDPYNIIHDGDNVDLQLCCDCFDKIVSECNVSPIEEVDDE